MTDSVRMAFQATPARGSALANGPLTDPGPAARQPSDSNVYEGLHYEALDLEVRTVKNEIERGFNLCCPHCQHVYFVLAAEILDVLHFAYSAHRQPVNARIQFSGAFARLFSPETSRRNAPVVTALAAFVLGLAAGIHPLVSGWLALMVGLAAGLWICRVLVEPLLRVPLARKMPVFLVACPHCQQPSAVASDGEHFFAGG